MDVAQILSELRAERDRLDKAIAALGGINSTGRAKGTVPTTTRRRRRRLNAAARKRLSQLLKKRWASGKMGKRKSKAA